MSAEAYAHEIKLLTVRTARVSVKSLIFAGYFSGFPCRKGAVLNARICALSSRTDDFHFKHVQYIFGTIVLYEVIRCGTFICPYSILVFIFILTKLQKNVIFMF